MKRNEWKQIIDIYINSVSKRNLFLQLFLWLQSWYYLLHYTFSVDVNKYYEFFILIYDVY